MNHATQPTKSHERVVWGFKFNPSLFCHFHFHFWLNFLILLFNFLFLLIYFYLILFCFVFADNWEFWTSCEWHATTWNWLGGIPHEKSQSWMAIHKSAVHGKLYTIWMGCEPCQTTHFELCISCVGFLVYHFP